MSYEASYHSARVSCRNAICWDRFDHHASRANHTPCPNGNSLKNDATSSYQDIVLNDNRGGCGCGHIFKWMTTDTIIQVMGIGIHQNTIGTNIDMVAYRDTFVCPKTRGTDPTVMPDLYFCSVSRTERATDITTQCIKGFAAGKDKIVANGNGGWGMLP